MCSMYAEVVNLSHRLIIQTHYWIKTTFIFLGEKQIKLTKILLPIPQYQYHLNSHWKMSMFVITSSHDTTISISLFWTTLFIFSKSLGFDCVFSILQFIYLTSKSFPPKLFNFGCMSIAPPRIALTLVAIFLILF